MEEKFCPCCRNRCPVDALSCGKGRAYFGVAADGHTERGGHGHPFAESDDEVVNLLLKCGHALHHSHGNNAKIDCLSEGERARLIELLKKCLKEIQ